MLLNNRIILKSGSTLTDLTTALNDYLAGTVTLPIVAATDTLFIGSELPFNHRWFEVSSANALASSLTVSVWSGSQWNECVEVIDQTAAAGAPFARSGIISWTVDRHLSWGTEDTTREIPALSSLEIYDLYWTRIEFSADLTGTTALKFVGHKFSSDAELASQYPELSGPNVLAAFQSGKTTWADQKFEAAEYIINDLISTGVAKSGDQIMDWRIFKNASVHKTAEIIFRAFGDDYKDQLLEANKAYKAAMDPKMFRLDKNNTGRLEPIERYAMTGAIRR